jgi:SnoaL-like protein
VLTRRDDRLDPDKLDVATAELDARYAAGEAAGFSHVLATMRAFRDAFTRRDWDALEALMVPDLEIDDHRLLAWETLRGAATYVQALRSLVELAPDTRLRLDLVEMSQRGLLWIGAWVGTREGGAYEIPWITVSEHDASGIMLHFEVYDLDQLPDARARFAELAAPRVIENAATDALDRFVRAWLACDWEALRACFAPEYDRNGANQGLRSATTCTVAPVRRKASQTEATSAAGASSANPPSKMTLVRRS